MESRVWGAGFGAQGLRCRVWGAGFEVQGLGCRVWGAEWWGAECWVHPPPIADGEREQARERERERETERERQGERAREGEIERERWITSLPHVREHRMARLDGGDLLHHGGEEALTLQLRGVQALGVRE